MKRTQTEFDPYLHDPLRWGASMVHHAEMLLGCMDVVGASSVVEVGAYAGDLTRVLVDWAAAAKARVVAIDPSPQPDLVKLAEERDELELVRKTSLEALPDLALPDVFVIDGDHNYYTVSEELRLIDGRANGSELPLLLFHDVCWPHGRRDDYFDSEQIPADFRQPVAGKEGIFPGEPGLRPDGLPYPKSAAREGGPRNGVRTAIEDFVSERAGLRLVVVPAFFGFGAVWPRDASWAGELAELLDPWDGNPLLERLESNRVRQLAEGHAVKVDLWKTQARQVRQEAVLRRLLDSSAFAVAERLSQLRSRAGVATDQTVVSRELLRSALDD